MTQEHSPKRGLKARARDAAVLSSIRRLGDTNWRELMREHETLGWPVLRVSLKRLRDAGLILASTEYTDIRLAPEQVIKEAHPHA